MVGDLCFPAYITKLCQVNVTELWKATDLHGLFRAMQITSIDYYEMSRIFNSFIDFTVPAADAIQSEHFSHALSGKHTGKAIW